jgi:activator of 2-hydroxyglutaryl-CoA dehydratase
MDCIIIQDSNVTNIHTIHYIHTPSVSVKCHWLTGPDTMDMLIMIGGMDMKELTLKENQLYDISIVLPITIHELRGAVIC